MKEFEKKKKKKKFLVDNKLMFILSNFVGFNFFKFWKKKNVYPAYMLLLVLKKRSWSLIPQKDVRCDKMK